MFLISDHVDRQAWGGGIILTSQNMHIWQKKHAFLFSLGAVSSPL